MIIINLSWRLPFFVRLFFLSFCIRRFYYYFYMNIIIYDFFNYFFYVLLLFVTTPSYHLEDILTDNEHHFCVKYLY